MINLQELTLGKSFTLPLNIPLNIRILKLNCNNINIIENLPNTIEELYFGIDFNLELNNLSSSIKIIKFDIDSSYNKKIV